MIHSDINQILRQRGASYEIITEDEILKHFLRPGGDYTFWFVDKRRGANIFDVSGANIYNWSLVDPQTVELSYQFDEDTKCLIKLDVLWNVIDKLSISRHLEEKYFQKDSEILKDRKRT